MTVTNFDEFVSAVRTRRAHLGMSCEDVDAKSGLPDRYHNKLEVGSRGFGKLSLGLTLETLGLEMIVRPRVQEPAARESETRH